ncbi:MAG: response regulator [Bacteroidota bacterium]|jgi:DNA-binding response OmpR family regulator
MKKTDEKRGTETILLVEDEEMLLDLMKTLLEAKGYHVLTAEDGVEAVEVFTRHKDEIAVVISDMGLPKLGGWEAFQKMREIRGNVNVILASGYFDFNLKADIIKAGAKDFVQKPYDPEEITEKIREVISNSKK